jgi:hypothetical protein
MWSGFVLARTKNRLKSLLAQIAPESGWRLINVGDIQLRVPPSWGDVELNPAGGQIIHNRPRRFRVDGDAVWYASAIELRIRSTDFPPTRSEAMTTYRRTIKTAATDVVLELAIANGVSPAQQRLAQRVLASAALPME